MGLAFKMVNEVVNDNGLVLFKQKLHMAALYGYMGVRRKIQITNQNAKNVNTIITIIARGKNKISQVSVVKLNLTT